MIAEIIFAVIVDLIVFLSLLKAGAKDDYLDEVGYEKEEG